MTWRMGYPSGLFDVSSEEEGRNLYALWGLGTITLESTTPQFTGSQVTAVGSNYITGRSNAFGADEYNGGFLKLNHMDDKGKVYKVLDTSTDTITVDGDPLSDGVSVGDYFEVMRSGSFTFPTSERPELINTKISMNGTRKRLEFNRGAIDTPFGRNAESFVMRLKLDNESDLLSLFTLLSNPISYTGLHAINQQEEAAPLVVEDETGKQYLLHIQDGKVIGDGKMGPILTISLTLSQYVVPRLRGY